MNLHTSVARRTLIASFAAVAMLATACANGDTDDLGDPLPDTSEQEAPADDAEAPVDDDVDEEPDGDAAGADDDASAAPEPDTPSAKPPTPRPSTTPAPAPEPTPASTPPPAPPTLADGTYEGTLVSLSATSATLDLVEVLSGQAAVEAALAAGVPLDEDGTLPNDVFIKDLGTRVTLPLAGDGGFQILDCSGGCEVVGTTLDALLDGSAKPYGGAEATFTVMVDAGSVVSLSEVYLP